MRNTYPRLSTSGTSGVAVRDEKPAALGNFEVAICRSRSNICPSTSLRHCRTAGAAKEELSTSIWLSCQAVGGMDASSAEMRHAHANIESCVCASCAEDLPSPPAVLNSASVADATTPISATVSPLPATRPMGANGCPPQLLGIWLTPQALLTATGFRKQILSHKQRTCWRVWPRMGARAAANDLGGVMW